MEDSGVMSHSCVDESRKSPKDLGMKVIYVRVHFFHVEAESLEENVDIVLKKLSKIS